MWHHVLLLSVSGPHRLWCQALLKLAALLWCGQFCLTFAQLDAQPAAGLASQTNWKIWRTDQTGAQICNLFFKEVQRGSLEEMKATLRCRILRLLAGSESIRTRWNSWSWSCSHLPEVKEGGNWKSALCVKDIQPRLYDPLKTPVTLNAAFHQGGKLFYDHAAKLDINALLDLSESFIIFTCC